MGVQCWGSTAFTIKGCGKFNAACTNDSQCATNTCNNGICNGVLASESWLGSKTSSVPVLSTLAVVPTGTGGLVGTGTQSSPTSTGSQLAVTNAASKRSVGGGVVAAVAIAAWAL